MTFAIFVVGRKVGDILLLPHGIKKRSCRLTALIFYFAGDCVDNCCCGFGHRDFYRNISDDLLNIIKNLVINENITTFLTGNMGGFDKIFSFAVRSCKSFNPDIKLILVMPYFSNKLNTQKQYYEQMYDEIIIPEEMDGCYYKAAITKRNRWMVDESQIIISGVYYGYGGAYDTIKYANRKSKQVIELF